MNDHTYCPSHTKVAPAPCEVSKENSAIIPFVSSKAEQALFRVFNEEQSLFNAVWEEHFGKEIDTLRDSASKKEFGAFVCTGFFFICAMVSVFGTIATLVNFSWGTLGVSLGTGLVGYASWKMAHNFDRAQNHENDQRFKLYGRYSLDREKNKELLGKVHTLLMSNQASNEIKPLLVDLFKALKQNKGCCDFWKKIEAKLTQLADEYKHAQMEQDIEDISVAQINLSPRKTFSI